MMLDMTSTHQNQNPRPLDQAPAADPALDALDRLLSNDEGDFAADVASIRTALADRITPVEARILGMYMRTEHASELALIARLNRIADQETGR